MRVEAKEGSLYRVQGAAKVRVVSGEVYALGCRWREGDELTVVKDRIVCIQATTNSVLDVALGSEGKIELAEKGEVIESWKNAVEEIVNKGYRRIIVLGEPDSGKTTLTTFLLNAFIEAGHKAAVIDSDPGQNDIGYPGTVAMGFPEERLERLGQVRPRRLYFIGDITPRGCEGHICLAIKELAKELSGEYRVVLNTDGWIRGFAALQYKLLVIASFEPEIVVVMRGQSDDSLKIVKMLKHLSCETVLLPTPPARQPKSRGVRKIHRELSYVDFLLSCTRHTLSLDGISMVGLDVEDVHQLEELPIDAIVGIKTTGDSTILYSRRNLRSGEINSIKAKLGTGFVKVVNLSELRGLLVGLFDGRVKCVGVGVLERIDIAKRSIVVKTPVPDVESVRLIVPGRIRVTQTGELKRLEPAFLARVLIG